jgi:hypothetical protein
MSSIPRSADLPTGPEYAAQRAWRRLCAQVAAIRQHTGCQDGQLAAMLRTLASDYRLPPDQRPDFCDWPKSVLIV